MNGSASARGSRILNFQVPAAAGSLPDQTGPGFLAQSWDRTAAARKRILIAPPVRVQSATSASRPIFLLYQVKLEVSVFTRAAMVGLRCAPPNLRCAVIGGLRYAPPNLRSVQLLVGCATLQSTYAHACSFTNAAVAVGWVQRSGTHHQLRVRQRELPTLNRHNTSEIRPPGV